MAQEQKAQSVCARCRRKLTDPVSVRRGMGPVCWSQSNGGIFDKDLEASNQEWARRERLLRNGGEIDFGTNWQCIDPYNEAIQLTMRVSVRYKDGAFEAYGHVYRFDGGPAEIVFARCADIRTAYQEAILAGPACNAVAYAAQKATARAWKAQQKKRGVA